MYPRLQLISFGQMVDGIEGRKSLAGNHDGPLAWGRRKGDNDRAILISFVFLTTEPNGCILDTFFSFINNVNNLAIRPSSAKCTEFTLVNKRSAAFSRTNEIYYIHTVFIHLVKFKTLRNSAEGAIVEGVSFFRIRNQSIQIDVGLYLTKLGFVKIEGVDFKHFNQKRRYILNVQLQNHRVCRSKLRLVGIAKINIDAFA